MNGDPILQRATVSLTENILFLPIPAPSIFMWYLSTCDLTMHLPFARRGESIDHLESKNSG